MSASEQASPDVAFAADAERLMARCDTLGALTDEPGRITRLAFSPALRAANQHVLGWMREAGLEARIDAAGNVVGRYEGREPGARALMVGSHLDTVRDGGRYDGPLGVLAGIEAVDRLNREGRRLAHAIEVVAFADEEGVRFGGWMLGSAAVAGQVASGWAERRDVDGMTAGDALRAFGIDPGSVEAASRAGEPPLAYLELHIEQGPVLEQAGVSLGCVTAIAGATRMSVTVDGTAGHAGTVPMRMRRDALAAASECVLAVERCCGKVEAVGTVGQLTVDPNASNVIAGRVHFTLDIRAAEDHVRLAAVEAVLEEFRAIAARRGIGLDWTVTSQTTTTPCSPRVMRAIQEAVAMIAGGMAPLLPSGAGHDGIPMSAITEIGMIFLRCAGGISHNPAESITLADAQAGIEALFRCCVSLG